MNYFWPKSPFMVDLNDRYICLLILSFFQVQESLNGQQIDWSKPMAEDSSMKKDMDVALALKQTVESSSEA